MLDLRMGAPPCLLPAPCTFAAGDNDCLAESIGGGGGERSLSIMRADKYVNCAVLACPCAGASSGGVSAFAVGATAACGSDAHTGKGCGGPWRILRHVMMNTIPSNHHRMPLFAQ